MAETMADDNGRQQWRTTMADDNGGDNGGQQWRRQWRTTMAETVADDDGGNNGGDNCRDNGGGHGRRQEMVEASVEATADVAGQRYMKSPGNSLWIYRPVGGVKAIAEDGLRTVCTIGRTNGPFDVSS